MQLNYKNAKIDIEKMIANYALKQLLCHKSKDWNFVSFFIVYHCFKLRMFKQFSFTYLDGVLEMTLDVIVSSIYIWIPLIFLVSNKLFMSYSMCVMVMLAKKERNVKIIKHAIFVCVLRLMNIQVVSMSTPMINLCHRKCNLYSLWELLHNVILLPVCVILIKFSSHYKIFGS